VKGSKPRHKISANVPASANLNIYIYETGAGEFKLLGINSEMTGSAKRDIFTASRNILIISL
jgi:hypothetical protein